MAACALMPLPPVYQRMRTLSTMAKGAAGLYPVSPAKSARLRFVLLTLANTKELHTGAIPSKPPGPWLTLWRLQNGS